MSGRSVRIAIRGAAAAAAAAVASVGIGSCAEARDVAELFSGDIQPPGFESAFMNEERRIILQFSEDSAISKEALSIAPQLDVDSVRSENHRVVIELGETPEPGSEYTVQAIAVDKSGNRLSFLTRVYGYNPQLPAVRINELTTQGSSRHPDIVELLVLRGGNLGGITVYAGSRSDYDSRITLPPLQVGSGDFILIHFKPEGIPAEKNEPGDLTESGGLDASDAARDFWVAEGSGLSGNNGAVSVYSYPGGELLDAVIYSNRTSDSDERYSGFGSKAAVTRIEEVVADGGWRPAGERVAPEDAVDPEDSTATRSLNRAPGAADTDTKTDWYIGPTSSASFGSVNTTERYDPGA